MTEDAKNIALKYPRIYNAATSDTSRAVLARVHFNESLALAANGFLAVVCAVTKNSHGPIALGKDSMKWLCGRAGEVRLWIEKIDGKFTVDRREYGSAARNRTIVAEDYDKKFVKGVVNDLISPLLDQADLEHAICLKPAYLKQVMDTFGKTDGVYLVPTIPEKIKPKKDENSMEKKRRETKDVRKKREAPIIVMPIESSATIVGILMPMHGSYGEDADNLITRIRKNIPGLRSGDAKQLAKKMLPDAEETD